MLSMDISRKRFIKDISKNLAVKNIIKMEAMTSEQASLNAYANTAFYAPKDIYLDQLNIFDMRLSKYQL